MNKLYEKNLSLLKKYHSYFLNYLEKSYPKKYEIFFKDNHLKINKITCFSKYNPEKEAERIFKKWIEENKNVKNVIIFGISNPYLIKKFIENFNVSIIIPDITIFKEILKYFDFTEIIKKVDKFLIEGKIPSDSIIYPLKAEEKLFNYKLKKILQPEKDYLKVLLVNPIYGGSLPIANYISLNLKKFKVKLKVFNSEILNNFMNYLKKSFQSKPFSSKAMELFLNFISEIIMCKIEEFQPDILLGVAQSPIGINVLKYCNEKNITKIFWFMEDYKLFTYWRQFAPYYDFYFTIQKDDFFNELKKIGVKNYYYLPVAAEPSVHKPLNLNEEEKKYYGSTLSFVGAGYYNRRIFFRQLLDYDFKIWGSDWEGETILKDKIQKNAQRVTPEEYVKIFNASLININLHSSTYLTGIDPDGDFVNPRTFEIAATNSIQIVDRRKYLPELFNENDEILVYSNESEFKDLIDKILKNPECFKNIAEKGYKRVLKEHTYEHRLIKMFDIIGYKLKKFEISENEPDFYFFKFDTLEDMANYIKKKNKINETEKIILLMNALKETYLR